MNRLHLLKNLLGTGLLPLAALARPATSDLDSKAQRVRRELLQAWARSERLTLITATQMPADAYDFTYLYTRRHELCPAVAALLGVHHNASRRTAGH